MQQMASDTEGSQNRKRLPVKKGDIRCRLDNRELPMRALLPNSKNPMTVGLNRRCFPADDALECWSFRREARAAKESDRIHAVMKINGLSGMGTGGYFPNIGECSIGYRRYSHVVKIPDCRWNCRSPANKTIDDRYRIRITGRKEKTSELQDKENRTTMDSVGWK